MIKRKILVICGPTAVGKTKLAINLAKKFNGELVSADSRQVYIGMDIITGKDIISRSFQKATPLQPRCHIGTISKGSALKNVTIGYYQISGINLWLTDTVKPDYRFNVSDYVELANKVIKDILSRGKLPVIVGGTGFYLRGLFGNIGTLGIPPNKTLRKELDKLTVTELQNKLDQLGKQSPEFTEGLDKFNQSDINNPRRLIRAIEITDFAIKHQNKIPCSSGVHPESNRRENRNLYNLLTIGLTAENKMLYRRIDQRVDERIKTGAENEVRNLLKSGFTFEDSALGSTIGYREWQDYFNNKIDLDSLTKDWQSAEHHYAKRQMTWFKKIKVDNWYNICDKDWDKNVVEQVGKWYTQKDANQD